MGTLHGNTWVKFITLTGDGVQRSLSKMTTSMLNEFLACTPWARHLLFFLDWSLSTSLALQNIVMYNGFP